MKKIKCLTKSTIQHLIDNELNAAEKAAAKQHIAVCEKCHTRFSEQKQFSKFFKANRLDTVKSPVTIPVFEMPLNKKRAQIKTLPFWLKVAAALVLAVLVWKFIPQTEPVKAQFTPTAEQIKIYEILHDVDANTAFQQKMIFVTVETVDN